ncbi:LysE/ArgO family amino acid transporter [Paracidovorax konjaci]|uniref:L-lysine exporter family protein LysE/ArgO n=1 Tax=Paracidovorax konjaci TaxID=32040 RepID=A0A1I1YUK8_9BURK|nr:LysE family transporter [Paracidovorax konjaci]SFE22678.1 L-lysine exporter family protein LysE/ArgO [Paracidovorax konjaci]
MWALFSSFSFGSPWLAGGASAAWVAGFTVCLSLIVSIGAQNAYVLRQAVAGRHVRVCVALCVLADAVLIGAGVAGLARLLESAPGLGRALTMGGAVFLLAYGLFAWHRALFGAGAGLQSDRGRARQGLLGVVGTLAAITLLNPHTYLDTVVLVGSIGARQEGALKWVFVAGSASASLLWFVLLAFAGRRLQAVFARALAWRLMDGITGAIMLGLSFWLWRGLA